jgi:alpha-D-ribose 1-methylphosphonate 5-triphosphate synthase subunit PhnG
VSQHLHMASLSGLAVPFPESPMTSAIRDTETEVRRAEQSVLSTLARAPAAVLATAWERWRERHAHRIVRGPETGLVMVRGRTGGAGAPFNLGEATVTRTTVRLDSGEIGHSYALGRDGEKSVHAALFHALWQREAGRVETEVLAPIRRDLAEKDAQQKRETAATKVDFFTMVRGDD